MIIVNFAFNHWSRYWKRNQTLFYLISCMDQVKYGYYINPVVWLTDYLRSPASIFETSARYILTRSVSSKIKVSTPVYLPFVKKSKVISNFNRFVNRLRFSGINDNKIILVLNNLQSDHELVDFIAQRAFLTIFDWSDDFVEFSSNTEERSICNKRCESFCKMSDVVLTINDDLRNRALNINENSYVIKNATNYFTFENHSKNSDIVKKVLRPGGTAIGYVGWLNSLRLDLELISFLVHQRPEYVFVFMGPMSEKQPLGAHIPKADNVIVLPPVPYEEYPACLRAFDVCILPNLINAHTSGNDPIKIYDYLASGRPVVATQTAGTERFADLLYLANDKQQFLALLDQAVQENSEFLAQNRISVARQHSWQNRFVEVEEIIKKYLN